VTAVGRRSRAAAAGALLALSCLCRAEEPYVTPLPEGSALVECESLPRSAWHRYDDPEASGGAKLVANQPDWVAEGEVELPPGSYVLWVRSGDSGSYPGHYQYDLTVDATTRTMATVEPMGRSWVWERWGEVAAGRHTVRLDRADSFASRADCLLFTPDRAYRPSGRPLVEVSATVPDPLPRTGARCELVFTPREPLSDQKLFCSLRRGAAPVWRSEVELPVAASRWEPGGPERVAVSAPALRFVAPGKYGLYAELSGCEYAGHEEGDYQVAKVRLGPWQPVEPCVARVREWRAAPTVFVNGKPLFAVAFLGTSTGLYHEFAEAGCHLYSVSCSIGNGGPEGFDPTDVDAAFRDVLAQDPEALILPRVGVTAPQWWLEAHPDQRVVFDDGSPGPQSMASERWLDDVGAQLAAFMRHVRSSPYADRVIGVHFCSGVSAEWQAWGLWSERRGDFSRPMRRAFAGWLKGKYGSTPALRGAWRDETAPDLDSAEGVPVPSREEREAAGPVLLSPTESQRLIDFYEFYPTVTARAILHFARVVKRASEGQMLAGVFYGYAPQYGPLAPESQHLALATVLASPDVDFLCSPAMYSERQPGGTTNFMSLTDTVQLHGKFWFDEADIRTHLQDDKVGRCATMEETLGVLKREYGAVRAHGVGMWWFDMASGWFSAPEIRALFADMDRHGSAALRGDPGPRFAPEIAVFLDEKSAFRQRLGGGQFWHFGITMQIAGLRRVGAPVACHLLSDLGSAPDYKVNLLLNATDLTPAQRRLINTRLKRDGKTVVFAYAPGFGQVDERGMVSEDLRGVTDLTGCRVSLARSPGPMPATLAADDDLCRNPVLIPAYGGEEGSFGPRGDFAPRFFIEDDKARVLARYPDGRVALALKAMDGWTSVYSAVPGLPPGVLHNLAEGAGVHLFTEAGDALYAGRGIIAVHAREAGEKTVYLPGVLDVRELLGAREWPAARELRLQLGEKETVVLAVANPRE